MVLLKPLLRHAMHTHRTELPPELTCLCLQHVILPQFALLNWKIPQFTSWALSLPLVVYNAHIVRPQIPAEIT